MALLRGADGSAELCKAGPGRAPEEELAPSPSCLFSLLHFLATIR